MILEIDAGNTRVKWRIVRVGSDGAHAVLKQGAFLPNDNSPELLKEFDAMLAGLHVDAIARVLVSNVRGEKFSEALAGFFGKCCGIKPEFAGAVRNFAGVESGYDDPAKLGVDRWLAILAAYNSCKHACCILDCGTTITLDLVAANGKHLGGYIVPGITLMRDTLARRSSALINDVPAILSCDPGSNTAAAINNGLLAMVIGFVSQIRNAHLEANADVHWFICGGDGEALQKFLPWETRLVPALVLDGLRLALPGVDQRGSR